MHFAVANITLVACCWVKEESVRDKCIASQQLSNDNKAFLECTNLMRVGVLLIENAGKAREQHK